MIAPGQSLGPYRILAPLGAGGMGEVYRARDTKLDRDVAIKVLSADVVGDAAARLRLTREAKLVASLNHPSICTVHDVGDANGVTYLAMELVDGRALADLIPEHGLPIDRALDYATQDRGRARIRARARHRAS